MLEIKHEGPVLFCTLNRPEVRNAFNDELIKKLTEVFLEPPDGTRAIVLAGAGKTFCAGGDLEWMRKAAAYSEEENFQDALALSELFYAISHSRAVVIARVHGAAFGGGCGLVAASDVAIAAEEAIFAFSEVRLGLVPATISSYVVPKIGPGHARSLFATGEAFTAERALTIGLVHEVTSGDQLDEAVESKLKVVLGAGPKAVYEAKRLALEAPLTPQECAHRLAVARASEEGEEGVAAFLERRKASFVVERP